MAFPTTEEVAQTLAAHLAHSDLWPTERERQQVVRHVARAYGSPWTVRRRMASPGVQPLSSSYGRMTRSIATRWRTGRSLSRPPSTHSKSSRMRANDQADSKRCVPYRREFEPGVGAA